MSGIKNLLLQNNVFNEDEVKILSILSVCKANAKKSRATSVLVLLAQNDGFKSIVEVKVQEFKKKRTWQLDELKLVDVHFNEHEFELVVGNDAKFAYSAILLNEKQVFLTSLYHSLQNYQQMEKSNIFKNIPESWRINSANFKESTVQSKKNDEDEISKIEFDDYKELSQLETIMLEQDRKAWLGDSENVIRNADLFIDYLAKSLIEMDGANVENILETKAEEKVLSLLQVIDAAIDEVEAVEKTLDEYEDIMSNIRDSMEKMGEKNSMIEIANKNNMKLLYELEKIVSQLDIAHAHQIALTETDLNSVKGLEAAKNAAKALQNAMSIEIDPALLRLAAVQDQKKRFDKWKAKFSNTIMRYLNNLFIHLGNDLGESHAQRDELRLPKHNHHRELSAYQELMHWMKLMDPQAYDALAKVYTNSLSKVYERDIRHFFEQAKTVVLKNHAVDEANTSVGSKSKPQQAKVPVYGILGIPKDQWSTAIIDEHERKRFDGVLEKVLTELEPVALSEQKFCINFFQLDVLSPTTTSKNPFAITPSKEKEGSIVPQKRLDRQINEEVRRMMSELFGILESELLSFIVNFEKLDPL